MGLQHTMTHQMSLFCHKLYQLINTNIPWAVRLSWRHFYQNQCNQLWGSAGVTFIRTNVINCAKFHLYCLSSFWVTRPQKLGVPIDLRSHLYNSYSSTELCCDIAWSSAGFNNAYSLTHVSQPAILTRKLGHTDLVFGMQSEFISRSVDVRLQVSVCSGYNLIDPDTQTDDILTCWANNLDASGVSSL